MTSSMGFYVKQKVLESNSFEDDDLFGNEDDDVDFDSQGYLYEVPYTSSSSVDRSSIGSIPWADDAIKINKIEWEKVEKMLNGLEPVSIAEDDLRKEILDWQKKFPQILNKNKNKENLKTDSLDIESLPSLELTSDDENYETEDKVTLTRERVTDDIKPIRKLSEEDCSQLCQLMEKFTLKSVPFKLNQRITNRPLINERKCASSTSSYSLRSPPTPAQVPLITTSTNRFRMPPLLNVLDSKRKFRNLAQNKNHSFVQLTQIQQAKSAVVAQEQNSRSRFHAGHRSAWHVPFVAGRFSNNKNSIILPSINTKHQVCQRYSTQQPITTSTTSEHGNSNTTPYSNGTRPNLLRSNLTTKHHFVLEGSTTNASTQTNSTSNTTISGRSISAAVKYPRVTTFNALYLPYSATKFNAFK